MDKRLTRALVLLIVLLFGAAAALLFLNRAGTRAPSGSSVPVPVQAENEAVGYAGEPGPAVSSDEDPLVDDVHVVSPKAAEQRLLADSFSALELPGNTLYAQTASQSIPEVVADLGDFRLWSAGESPSTHGSLRDLRHWRRTLPANVRVMRLIEEGRKDPEFVASLLRESISEVLKSYDACRQARADEYAAEQAAEKAGRLQLKGIPFDDPYYAEHRKYESPSMEFGRLNYVGCYAFYILANIGELAPPQLLAEWLGKEKPYGYQATDLDIWLVDCYFKQAASDESAYAARHATLVGDAKISGSFVARPCWNAYWDTHDKWPESGLVRPWEIKTIDVLAIPQSLPFDDDVKKQIIENFQQYAKDSR